MSRALRRLLAALSLVALSGVIGAGCGSSEPSETSAASSTGATGSAVDKQLSKQEQGVKFAECLRANGVPHFPDPDPSGESNFGIDVSPKVFTKAVNACKALKPPGALSAKRTPKEQAASLRFAQCVREHGVKDFPDSVSGEPLIDTTRIPSANKPGGMDILNAATQKCGYILKFSAGGQGSGGSGG